MKNKPMELKKIDIRTLCYGKRYERKSIIKELNTLVKKIKEKYKIDTSIDIMSEGTECFFDRDKNHIECSLSMIKEGKTESQYRCEYEKVNLKDFYKFVLLHELYHAIDYKYNKRKFNKELTKMNTALYFTDGIYHDNQPFEKRADAFANRELKRIKQRRDKR